MEDFNGLDLRPSQLGSADIIGDAYEYMIAMFASDAGKKGGEFFTPSQVSELVASLVQPKENDRIYDPTCGSGGLLLKAYKKVPSGKVAVYGQELNAQTWALCTMNMFLHGVDDARIWQGDTLSNPQNVEDDKLMKFQVVVANPPFSLDKWDSGFLSEAEADSKGKKKMSTELDPYHRFDWGVPPTSKGDYAFVLHMLASLDAENGRMAVVLPHGVLFRGASEGKIRRQLVEMNLLDAVIGLPANLFYSMAPESRPVSWYSRRTAPAGMCCSSTPLGTGTLKRVRTRTFCGTAILNALSMPIRRGRTRISIAMWPPSMRSKRTTST